MEINSLSCCGIDEMANIVDNDRDPQFSVATYARNGGGAFALFSSITNGRGEAKSAGKQLADYIEKNKLGTVVRVGRSRNPNTDNMLTMWVWTVDQKALAAWKRKSQDKIESDLEYIYRN